MAALYSKHIFVYVYLFFICCNLQLLQVARFCELVSVCQVIVVLRTAITNAIFLKYSLGSFDRPLQMAGFHRFCQMKHRHSVFSVQ